MTHSLLLPILLIMSVGFQPKAKPDNSLVNRALAIHKSVLTLDSHSDTPLQIGRSNYDVRLKNDPTNRGGKIDFPRMKEGGLDAVFFAVFVSQGDRNEQGNQRATARAKSIFETISKTMALAHQQAEIALSPADAYRLKKAEKLAVYLGVENGYAIGRDLSLIEAYYNLGARYITLSHTRNNDICDSSTDPKGPEHNGLSAFGREVVKEMNRVGMMIDVSHISDKAFFDVLQVSKFPVIASHSNARFVCNNPRNLTDDMLLALKKNGGVVQLCLLSAYVKEPEPNPARTAAREAWTEKYGGFDQLPEDKREQARAEWQAISTQFPEKLATVSNLIDHLDHIVKVIGVDFVGIGSDFDGGGGLSDCFDVSQMANITVELVRRGYTKKDIEKIWAGNFMRVFRKVQAARQNNYFFKT